MVQKHSKLIGSPLHLRQILLNLFSNAAKYNKENGTIETYAEEIACDENTATFRFTIRDTGIGMSEDFVNNELFEPFTQEKQGARTQYQGTGLGMSIVKELIAMTANAFSEDVERSRKAGMTEHLSKPLNAETLKKAILRNI